TQEMIWQGDDLLNGHGLDMLPVPISTPSFVNAPYLTSANWITKNSDTDIYNIGNYRSQIKAPNQNGRIFFSHHIGQNCHKCSARGIPMQRATGMRMHSTN